MMRNRNNFKFYSRLYVMICIYIGCYIKANKKSHKSEQEEKFFF